MIKGKTALTVYIELYRKLGGEPSREEFMALGYSQASYYRARKDFREEESVVNGEQKN